MFNSSNQETWCDSHLSVCITNNVISTGCMILLGILTFFHRRVYKEILRVHDVEEFGIFQSLLHPQRQTSISKIKYLITQLCLVGLFCDNAIQIVIWLSTQAMSPFFGVNYIMETLFWLASVFILFLDYKGLKEISRSLKICWFTQLVYHLVYIIAISIIKAQDGIPQEQHDEMDYQTSIHIIALIILILLNVISVFMGDFTSQDIVQEEQPQVMVQEDDDIIPINPVARPQFVTKLAEQIQSQVTEANQGQQQQSISEHIFVKLEVQPTNTLMNDTMTYQESLDSTLPSIIDTKVSDNNPFSIQRQETDSFRSDDYNGTEFIIQIEGFKEVKKFGKSTLVHIIRTTSSLGEWKAYRSYREFRQLYKEMIKMNSKVELPKFPEKKTGAQMLNKKDITERGLVFQELLQHFLSLGMNDTFKKFLMSESSRRKESEQSNVSEKSNQQDQAFDEMLKNKQNSLKIKRALDQLRSTPPQSQLMDLIQRIDNIDNFQSQNMVQKESKQQQQQQQQQQLPTCEDVSALQFRIREVQKKNNTTYYKIESIIQQKVIASVFRRFSEFKMLQKVLAEEFGAIVPVIQETSTVSDMDFDDQTVNSRKQNLQIYLNQIQQIRGVMENNIYKNFLGI